MFHFVRALVRKGTSGKSEGQYGFTLIEMSIVLAIIGLIVGGILKGSEVVNNGRLKMQVAQMDAVKAAIFTFQDQFTYLPGDYPTATTQLGFTAAAAGAGANGDGNGTIGTLTANPANAVLVDTADTLNTESVLVWAHLAAANLLQGVTLPAAQALNAVTPATALSYPGKMSGTFLWVANFNAQATAVNGVGGIVGPMIRLQAPINGTVTQASGQAVREPDAYNLDRKYDDGSPVTGSILVSSASIPANCFVAATSSYTLGNGSPNTNYCTLLWIVQ